MSTRTFLAVLRAARRQAALDLRAGVVGSGIALLASVSALVIVSRNTQASIGPMFLAGSIGTISCFITFQIASETYVDRIGGALLRVRVLPHGPLTWAIGKTMSSITQTLVFQGAILLGGALFVEALPLSTSQVLACLPLMVLSAVATAPLGFLVGAFVRGVYSFMASYLPMFALIGTSGFFMPMDRLPSWLQAVQLALPTYWSGHLTRWALVGDPSWEVGRAFSPVLAVGVLTVWTVPGFAGAAFLTEAASLFRGAGYHTLPLFGWSQEQGRHRGVPAPEHAALASRYAHVTAPLRRLVDRYGLEICRCVCAGEGIPQWVYEGLYRLPTLMTAGARVACQYENGALDAVEALVLAGREGEEFEGVVVDVFHRRRREGRKSRRDGRGGAGEAPGGSSEQTVVPLRGSGTVMLGEPAVLAPVVGDGLERGREITAVLRRVDLSTSTVEFEPVRVDQPA